MFLVIFLIWKVRSIQKKRGKTEEINFGQRNCQIVPTFSPYFELLSKKIISRESKETTTFWTFYVQKKAPSTLDPKGQAGFKLLEQNKAGLARLAVLWFWRPCNCKHSDFRVAYCNGPIFLPTIPIPVHAQSVLILYFCFFFKDNKAPNVHDKDAHYQYSITIPPTR